jgi:hypothetical protein
MMPRYTSIAKISLLILIAHTGLLTARASPAEDSAKLSASARFKIPSSDIQRYRTDVFDFGRSASLYLPPGEIYPKVSDKTAVPTHFLVARTTERSPVDILHSVKSKSICAGALERATVQRSEILSRFPLGAQPILLSRLFGSAVNSSANYRFYLSTNKRWVSRCWVGGPTCTNIFLNDGWIAEIIVRNEFLCQSPEMNARLAIIINRWI